MSKNFICTGLILVLMLGLANPAAAQNARFPASTVPPTTHQATTVYQGQLGPGVQPLPNSGPNTMLGQPTLAFDPYAPNAAANAPTLVQPGQPAYPTTPYGVASPPPPQAFGPNYPAGPPTMFPGNQSYFSTQGSSVDWGAPIRFIQTTQFQYTWLSGGNAKGLDQNEMDFNVTGVFPNFLQTGRPLMIRPGFILNLWAGPYTPAPGLPDAIPSKAYSAYLDTFYEYTSLQSPLGAEIGLRIGVHSDFSKVNHQSVRLEGLGLGVANLSPTTSLKFGVVYLDRLRVKILPAIGVFWTPDQDTKWEVFFPKPKFARRLAVFGTNYDTWWYLQGEYGGGSWTVNGIGNNRFDINDMRVSLGLEWTTPAQSRGWVEVGYVFEREVFYDGAPNFNMDSTFMLRGGFAF